MSRASRWRLLALRIALTAALLAVLVWRADPWLVWQTLKSLQPLAFVVAFALLFLSICVASLRWRFLLLAHGFRFTLNQLLKLNMVASFYNVVLPGQESGNAVKAFLLARSSGRASRVWASVVVDQMTLFVSLLLIGLAGLLLVAHFPGRSGWIEAEGGTLAALLVVLVFLFWPGNERHVRRLSNRLRWGRSHPEWLYPFWSAISSYRQQSGFVAAALLLGVVYQLMVDAAIFAVAAGFQLHISYLNLAWVLSVVYIAQSLPFTIAGLGVRESVLVYFFGALGLEAAPAIALSFTVAALYVAFALPGALLQLLGKQGHK